MTNSLCAMRAGMIGLLVAFGMPHLHAQPAQAAANLPTSKLPPAVPHGRPIVGVALEGGGALGLAHIGVLRWFEENHIPIDRLAGTSMGALIGGLYASGKTPHDLETLAESDLFGDIFSIETPYEELGYRRRQDRRDLPQAITLGLKHGVALRNAILSDSELYALLRSQFAANNQTNGDFDDLPIPFRCVATDLNSYEPVVFAGGSMADAVRASISIPGVFAPVDYRGHYLADGAMANNLPTNVARDDLRSEVVIAVHLRVPPLQESDVASVLGVVSRVISAGTSRSEKRGIEQADIVIGVDTEKYTTTDYRQADAIIHKGYEAAEEQRVRLLPLALSEPDWQRYVAARRSRLTAQPGLLDAVRVASASAAERKDVLASLRPLQGKAIDPASLTRALRHVEGSGTREASFTTFSTRSEAANAGASPPAADNGVLVRLREDREGPPYLLLGAEVTATTSNVTRSALDVRYVHQDLGGYGAELRAEASAGFRTQASAEYYRPMFGSLLFVQPHLGIVREPVYLWANQKRVAEEFHQVAGGGLDVGKTFTRNMQLAGEYRADVTRWVLRTGESISPSLSGLSQTALLHFSYDTAMTGAVSPQGTRLDLSAGSRFSSVASENAPMAHFSLARTAAYQGKNIFGFRVDADSYFRRRVADPFRFTLGGPLRLTASSIDEYRGTDTYLARAGYLRKIAVLPSGLGQGIYLAGAYEAGEVWSPEKHALLRENVLSALVASTPLGVLTFGGAVGDAGRRKIFFTLGKFF